MSDATSAFLCGLMAFIAVLAVVGALLTGCERNGQRWNEIAKRCIDAGGSWVPQPSGYLCIGGRR